MRVKGTDRRRLEKLADSVPMSGYELTYPSVRRRLIEILETVSESLAGAGLDVVVEKTQSADEAATRLARSFGLTPAELRLARHLADGGTLAAYAAEQNVSRNTARTHLSSIFQKTGVNRQADLVRLLLAESD